MLGIIICLCFDVLENLSQFCSLIKDPFHAIDGNKGWTPLHSYGRTASRPALPKLSKVSNKLERFRKFLYL